MRLRARIDANQPQIVRALRKAGAKVESLAQLGKGCPDLLVGFRGVNYLFEVKDGDKIPSARKLTDDESKWHEEWRGQVSIIENIEDALKFIGAI